MLSLGSQFGFRDSRSSGKDQQGQGSHSKVGEGDPGSHESPEQEAGRLPGGGAVQGDQKAEKLARGRKGEKLFKTEA